MSPFSRIASVAIRHPERSGMPAQRAFLGVEGPPHSIGTLWDQIVKAGKLAKAALHEIFDESAYERFLARHQLTSSASAYSRFCHDRERTLARRPRCC